MAPLTTGEAERLMREAALREFIPDMKRRRFLPTADQTKVLITFLRASELCESVKSTAEVRGMTIPKRAVCVGDRFKELYEDTLEWAERKPEDFKRIHEKYVYAP